MGGAGVDGLAESIEHAPDEARARHATRAASRRRHDAVAQPQPAGLLERHRQHAPVAEPDHLRPHAAPIRAQDLAEIPDRSGRAGGFYQQPHHFDHLAGPADSLHPVHDIEVRREIEAF